MCIFNHKTALHFLFTLGCPSPVCNTVMGSPTLVRHLVKLWTVELFFIDLGSHRLLMCDSHCWAISVWKHLLCFISSVKQGLEENNDVYCLHLTKK